MLMIPEDEEGPSFAYSVGMTKMFGHPEIAIFGLSPDLMHRIINLIGEAVKDGRQFSDSETASGFLEGFDVRFSKAARSHYEEHFGYASWYYKGDDYTVLQCLWPDRQGRFPSDPDFSMALRRRQPLLSASSRRD